jgi:thymidine kinase
VPLIKVYYGPKGTGKTKSMVDAANELSVHSKGEIVYIHNSDQLMYHLSHKIRFTNADEYPIINIYSMIGFISGIISQNYDIEAIFIDSLSYIVKVDVKQMAELLDELDQLSDRNNVDLDISISSDSGTVPSEICKYV